IKTLFETFGNRENETTSHYGDDLGLGLPLTQRLCRLMGGELTVKSEFGHGACFTIRIPWRPATEDGAVRQVAELVAVGREFQSRLIGAPQRRPRPTRRKQSALGSMVERQLSPIFVTLRRLRGDGRATIRRC